MERLLRKGWKQIDGPGGAGGNKGAVVGGGGGATRKGDGERNGEFFPLQGGADRRRSKRQRKEVIVEGRIRSVE